MKGWANLTASVPSHHIGFGCVTEKDRYHWPALRKTRQSLHTALLPFTFFSSLFLSSHLDGGRGGRWLLTCHWRPLLTRSLSLSLFWSPFYEGSWFKWSCMFEGSEALTPYYLRNHVKKGPYPMTETFAINGHCLLSSHVPHLVSFSLACDTRMADCRGSEWISQKFLWN